MNDTDRLDLLELAANAAGLTVMWSEPFKRYERFVLEKYAGPWNPLEHDGDALRLAVDLEIVIGYKPAPYAELPSRLRLFGVGKDQASRMRMAIVRAAAEIGKLKHSGEYCKRGVTHEQ